MVRLYHYADREAVQLRTLAKFREIAYQVNLMEIKYIAHHNTQQRTRAQPHHISGTVNARRGHHQRTA